SVEEDRPTSEFERTLTAMSNLHPDATKSLPATTPGPGPSSPQAAYDAQCRRIYEALAEAQASYHAAHEAHDARGRIVDLLAARNDAVLTIARTLKDRLKAVQHALQPSAFDEQETDYQSAARLDKLHTAVASMNAITARLTT